MYPATLDEQDVQSRAEVKLFAALRDQLDGAWEAYHSTSWTLRDPKYGARDGEIDFVVSHPKLGFLCVEAKSGGVRFKDGRWVRLERGKEVPYKTDPFAQAVGHASALRKLVKKAPGWRERKILIGHAVAFPEIPINQRKLPPGAPREIVIDRNDVQDVEGAIRRAFAFHAPDRNGRLEPGDRGTKMLRELLVPPMEIEVPLAEKFLDEEVALIELTQDQTMLLRRFASARRMVIAGCAGSGKTMLAVEQAKWLRREKGLRVAFVCFNKQLASYLKERERRSGVEFYTFHGLCTLLGHRAPGVEVPGYSGDPPQEYWLNELPEVLADAATELGGVFDAVMVDEAQDLHTHWLTALMCTLSDEDEGYVWLFMDANQRVYEATLDVPRDFFPFHLTVNCRNTQAIHREVMKKYSGEVVPEARGPEGRTPELIYSEDAPKTVAEVIERLCGKEDVPPQDVVVLSSHGWEKSEVARDLAGRYRLVKKQGELGKRVFFSSIRGFKGLESKVVILCELEDIEDESLDAQIYVGMSRAVNHCVVVAPGVG